MPQRRTSTRQSALLVAGLALLVAIGGAFAASSKRSATTGSPATRVSEQVASTTRTAAATQADATRPAIAHPEVGFASKAKLADHFRKHGKEFGDVTQAQYLSMAQALRDAPLSSQVIETEQVGGTISRYDRFSGGFVAFNKNLVIRTFFRPDDGEAYFWRAAKRSH